MRSRQRGATLVGTVVIIAILGFALYAGIRLMPVYLEYMAVVRALEQTAKEHDDGSTSPTDLRNAQGHRDQKGRRRLYDARRVSRRSAVRRQRLADRGFRQDRAGRPRPRRLT
jgi:hypothetical protein